MNGPHHSSDRPAAEARDGDLLALDELHRLNFRHSPEELQETDGRSIDRSFRALDNDSCQKWRHNVSQEKIAEPEKRSLPPYVPFKTFKNWLEGLRALGGTPGRIDRSVMPTMSGATQGQLVGALRYLGLVTQNGTPTEPLVKLVESDEKAQKVVLGEIITRRYPFLFATDQFNPRTATINQLLSAFQETGATGQTVRKCAAFLMLAAQEAALPLSPYFKGKGSTRVPRGASSRAKRTAVARTPQPDEGVDNDPQNGARGFTFPIPRSLPREVQGALQQLPEGLGPLTEEEIEDLVTVYRIALKRAYPPGTAEKI